jgi:ribosome biogenesis protein MAK21
MSMHGDTSFITCVLIIISQIVRNRNKLWKMVDKNSFSQKLDKKEENSKGAESDLNKRDPKFTNAEILPLSELTILTSHYHPTVQKFSKFILDNYNKDTIDYNGDPLIDFSLINFLEKFMLKNPKIKKEKKDKNRANKEEEDLKKFMEEDEEDATNKYSNSNIPDEPHNKFMQLDFISKFNEIEKTKSVKYEINQKKKEKKRVIEDADEFADKVIDEEYEKYDKDVDNDIDLDDEEGVAEYGEDDLGDDDEENFEENEEMSEELEDEDYE